LKAYSDSLSFLKEAELLLRFFFLSFLGGLGGRSAAFSGHSEGGWMVFLVIIQSVVNVRLTILRI
jgi:hypothetical protein